MNRFQQILNDFQITTSLGILAFFLVVGTAIGFAVTLAVAQYQHSAIDQSYLPWVDRWITFLQWLLGFVILGVVGKRATAKPEVIDAETRQAVATGSAPPPTPADVASGAATVPAQPSISAPVTATAREPIVVPTVSSETLSASSGVGLRRSHAG